MQRSSTGLPQSCRIATFKGRDLPFSLRHFQPRVCGVAEGLGFQIGGEPFGCVGDQVRLVRGLQSLTDTPLLQIPGPAARPLNSLAHLGQSCPLGSQATP